MALRPDRDKGTFPTCGLEMLVRIATLDLAPTKGETAVLAGYNENFVLLTTGITGVLSFEF